MYILLVFESTGVFCWIVKAYDQALIQIIVTKLLTRPHMYFEQVSPLSDITS